MDGVENVLKTRCRTIYLSLNFGSKFSATKRVCYGPRKNEYIYISLSHIQLECSFRHVDRFEHCRNLRL